MKNWGKTPKTIWYHDDGSINLQALATLVQRQSFPRSQSFYDRLKSIHNGTGAAGKHDHDRDDLTKLVPLQLLREDQLTPRRRAERDSFLATLMSDEDLSEEQLDRIALYLLPEEEDHIDDDDDSTPRSCLKKSPRPKSAAGKTTAKNDKTVKGKSPQQSPRTKSVRFTQSSPPPLASQSPPPLLLDESPRSPSLPSTRPVARRPSDPFHVASPLDSPRPLGSPDEVAFLRDIESPPLVPASPEPITEPKVTYYDDEGEEIEEEIPHKDQASETNADEEAAVPDEVICPDGSSRSNSAMSPEPESEVPEHLPDMDTPRVDRDVAAAPAGDRPGQSTGSDSSSPRPQGQSLSDSSESPRPSQSTRRKTAAETADHSPSPRSCGDSGSQKDISVDTSTAQPPRPPDQAAVPIKPRPDSAPAIGGSSPARDVDKYPGKQRPKSAKNRSRRSLSRSKSVVKDPELASETKETGKDPTSGGDEGSSPKGDTTGVEEEEEEEPPPIPVISLTRGQLPPVPARSPRIQQGSTCDTPSSALPQPKSASQEEPEPADSLRVQVHSPRSSTLQGADSSSVDTGTASVERRVRRKDDRMKIWLTKTAWDRHVECSVE